LIFACAGGAGGDGGSFDTLLWLVNEPGAESVALCKQLRPP